MLSVGLGAVISRRALGVVALLVLDLKLSSESNWLLGVGVVGLELPRLKILALQQWFLLALKRSPLNSRLSKR